MVVRPVQHTADRSMDSSKALGSLHTVTVRRILKNNYDFLSDLVINRISIWPNVVRHRFYQENGKSFY